MDLMLAAERERAELASLLTDLSPQEWDAPSLCAGWTVRDVVAHLLSYDDVGLRDVTRRAVAARFSPARLNESSMASLRSLPPASLVALMEQHRQLSGFVPTARGGAVALVDGLIHQQDIRRPLGRPRSLDPENLRFALGLAVTAPPLRGFWTVRGVRVVATDVDWAHGRGPEACGPGEAVLMALAGRRGAASDLTGPGAETLRRRLG